MIQDCTLLSDGSCFVVLCDCREGGMRTVAQELRTRSNLIEERLGNVGEGMVWYVSPPRESSRPSN